MIYFKHFSSYKTSEQMKVDSGYSDLFVSVSVPFGSATKSYHANEEHQAVEESPKGSFVDVKIM